MPKRSYAKVGEVRALARRGLSPEAIATELGIRLSHVSRILTRSPRSGRGLARAPGLTPTEQAALQKYARQLKANRKKDRANLLTHR